MVAVAVCARLTVYAAGANVQDLAYWTIIGRFDQFAIGIFFCHQRVIGRWAGAAFLGIAAVYCAFDAAGGFYAGPDWPWITLPTLEGLAFGAVISWYDANPIKSPKMWLVQKAGEYSYSIYLLHFFVVFFVARQIDLHIMSLNSIYEALPWALLLFIAMVGVGHVSYKFIEGPPLRFRKPYIVPVKSDPVAAVAH